MRRHYEFDCVDAIVFIGKEGDIVQDLTYATLPLAGGKHTRRKCTMLHTVMAAASSSSGSGSSKVRLTRALARHVNNSKAIKKES